MLKRAVSFYIRRARRFDFAILLLCCILFVTGVFFIYGTGQQIGGDFERFWGKQLIWVCIGVGIINVLGCANYRWLSGHYSWVVYALAVCLLAFVLVGGEVIHGARSWLSIPMPIIHTRVTIQPAEFGKPAVILALARLASLKGAAPRNWRGLLINTPLLFLPFLLICLQPDWGTALVFLAIGAGIIFVAGIPWRWIIMGALAVAVIAPLWYTYKLESYQRARIKTFINPSRDVSDTGWNAHQSLLAVGSGGLWGKGYLQGTQHTLGYLPQNVAPTDFIFSVIGEELGFVGAAAVVAAFIGILLCCLKTAFMAEDSFGRYICIGVAAMLFVHTYINVGMTMYLAPVIGIPLPFVSYGGSFVLSTSICIGLVQSVHVRRNALQKNAIVLQKKG